MNWMISDDKMGSDQREVIDEISSLSSRPIWIKGYAGSGKSVVLVHTLKDYLARNPNANVCIVVFTWALIDMLRIGIRQLPYLQKIPVTIYTIYQFEQRLSRGDQFDAIFCDEVQDIPTSLLKRMQNSCKHLIIAGDAAQSIYRVIPRFNVAPASSEEITLSLAPIEKDLRVIYRLTNSVINLLKNVYRNMFGDRLSFNDKDIDIKLISAADEADEIKYCWEESKQTRGARIGESVAILLSGHPVIKQFLDQVLTIEGKPQCEHIEWNNPNYDVMNRYLELNGVPVMYVGNGYGSLARADEEHKILIMTYHSAKGLDFDYVFLPLVGNGMWLHASVPSSALMLVALSRSKGGLTITYSGEQSHYIKPFLNDLPVNHLVDGQVVVEETGF